MPSNGQVAVELESISKRYFLNPQRPWQLKDIILHPRMIFSHLTNHEPFWALRDVSLTVRRGEFVGVIGANGSGKSTLLRVLVGISPPTTGKVTIHGHFAALLELGAGFHPHATGRQNAFLNALFMGLTKEEARQKLPEIIEFSELHEFIDQQMRTYSTGMQLRLGFSVAIHTRPEILLIDEILAVGDADFQEKCFAHFDTLQEQGTTIVLVTHDIGILEHMADRVVMLDQGRVQLDGDPKEVVSAYLTHTISSSPTARRSFASALKRQGLLNTDEDLGDGSPETLARIREQIRRRQGT